MDAIYKTHAYYNRFVSAKTLHRLLVLLQDSQSDKAAECIQRVTRALGVLGGSRALIRMCDYTVRDSRHFNYNDWRCSARSSFQDVYKLLDSIQVRLGSRLPASVQDDINSAKELVSRYI